MSFDGVAEGLLYAMLAFAPLAFGVVAAWSREVYVLLAAAAAIVVAGKHVARAVAGRPAGYAWSWAYPIMLAFLALCLLQLAPLPAAWARAVSPGTVRLKTELLADLPNVGSLLRRVTITFYPHATAEQTVLLAALCAVFVVVADVYREPTRIRRLLSVVAGMGLVVAGMAVYENLTGSTKVYGVVTAAHRNAGPFMNYSHFSQFVNLSVGAALALLLDRVAELSEFYRSPAEVWAALRQPRNAVVWAWALLCVVGPLTVMFSMSRMGVISLGVATVVSGAMLTWRGRAARRAAGEGRAWLLVGLAVTVFAVLLTVGFDVVSDRLGTLRDFRTTGRRDEMLRDMVAEFKQFPVLGTGLGTHEFVFGLYDHRNLATMASHAENEYAQLMEETGAIGVALAAAFLAGLAVSYVRATRAPSEPISYVPFGLGLGLIAILLHSGTDFGQHIPADATLTATFAALLTTFARRRPTEEPAAVAALEPGTVPPPAARRAWPVAGTVVMAVTVIAGSVIAGLWAERARGAEALWSSAQDQADQVSAQNWQASDEAYADLVSAASASAARDPGDVEHRYWADVYRWYSISHTADPATGRSVLPRGGLPAARAMVDAMDADRLLCPTFGLPLSVAGQINRDLLGQAARGEWEIQTSYRLAPYNTTVCLIAADDALVAHRWAQATDVLTRYAAMGGGIQDYADVCIAVGAADIASKLVKDDRAGLLYLASRMPAGDPRWQPWIAYCRRSAAKLLLAAAARPDASPLDLADLAQLDQQQGHRAEAIDLYRRALSAEYGNVGWRLQLARCLADGGRPADGVREARVVLQLRPEMPEATALLAELRVQAATQPSTAP